MSKEKSKDELDEIELGDLSSHDNNPSSRIPRDEQKNLLRDNQDLKRLGMESSVCA